MAQAHGRGVVLWQFDLPDAAPPPPPPPPASGLFASVAARGGHAYLYQGFGAAGAVEPPAPSPPAVLVDYHDGSPKKKRRDPAEVRIEQERIKREQLRQTIVEAFYPSPAPKPAEIPLPKPAPSPIVAKSGTTSANVAPKRYTDAEIEADDAEVIAMFLKVIK